ncbi:DUF6896 domain-containing protein [Pantoea agglomerans]|uniref:DUF6896 domain-containing protein n=1 Tax=Enterobacter agglomerans TaxID=549 RepID=UPI00320BA967
MKKNLEKLIFDFQESVQIALKIMHRSGIKMPSSRNDWIYLDIPTEGKLNDGTKYYKHGAGCLVSLNIGEVDFDFGEDGEIGGFNSWWLFKFSENKLIDYGFNSIDEIDKFLNEALEAGEIICNNYDLYYKTGIPLIYAIEIDSRHPEDMLPVRNLDTVLVLHSHYFQSADLMLENYDKINLKLQKKGHLNQRDHVDKRIYLTTWLGLLGVVCEGYRKLKMRILLEKHRPDSFKELIKMSDDLGKIMKEHADSLRKFRNDIFHLRENNELVRHFFERKLERLAWARELHSALADFFSQYRIICEVHYLLNGRKGECDLINSKKNKRKPL